jgi:hypothetical protein
MAKKSSKRASKPLAADEPATPLTAVNPLDKPERDGQRAGLAKFAATETQPVKPSAKPTPAEKPPALLAPLRPAATPPALPKSPEKTALVVQAPAPTTTRSVRMSFVLLDLAANRVSLSGDFNGWSPSATPMRRDSSGYWETTVDLAPGRYQYKFVVDGEWIPDPLAREHAWNHHGTLNSVLEVRP